MNEEPEAAASEHQPEAPFPEQLAPAGESDLSGTATATESAGAAPADEAPVDEAERAATPPVVREIRDSAANADAVCFVWPFIVLR
jgi:hypothetical protein